MGETMTLDLTTLRLDKGGHADRDDGVMEVVAWLAGEVYTDHPNRVCPVLGAFVCVWGDALDDEQWQRLIPYIPRMVGTAGDGHEEARSWLMTDWLVRVSAPAWLRLIARHDIADALERCAPVLSAEAARAAQGTLDEARRVAAALCLDLWHEWADTGDVAVRATGAEAAWHAPAAATTWDASRNKAKVVAWHTSRDVARGLANVVMRASEDMTKERLRPAVEPLRESAFGLLDSMLFQ